MDSTASSLSVASAQPSITYALSLWSTEPRLPLLETAPRLPHTLLFVGGLSDTLGSATYIERLAIAVAPIGFNVVQPQLTSSLGGFGVSSVEADAQEISLVLRHLRTRKVNAKHPDDKVVVMGHSTGCQDMVQLLLFDRPGVGVDGVVLQAPVSDRESFEHQNAEGSEARELLEHATDLVEQGRGAQLLHRKHQPPRRLRDAQGLNDLTSPSVNTNAVQDPAMTAYRYWSLNAKGGDEDFFSTDLRGEEVSNTWQKMLGKDRYVLVLLGAEDEYGPTTMAPDKLATQWSRVVEDRLGSDTASRFRAAALSSANHKVDDAGAQMRLADEVYALLVKMLGESSDVTAESDKIAIAPQSHGTPVPNLGTSEQGRGAEQYPASFDKVVELISTGQADSIPGIKDIPLQLNETAPSEPSMQRPLKPWERTGI